VSIPTGHPRELAPEPAPEHDDGSLLPELAAPPPTTGDPGVDAALRDFATAAAGDLDDQVAAGERVERLLRERLDDLAGG